MLVVARKRAPRLAAEDARSGRPEPARWRCVDARFRQGDAGAWISRPEQSTVVLGRCQLAVAETLAFRGRAEADVPTMHLKSAPRRGHRFTGEELTTPPRPRATPWPLEALGGR